MKRWILASIFCCILVLSGNGEEQTVFRAPKQLQEAIDDIWERDLAFDEKWNELRDFTWSLSIKEIKGYLAMDGANHSGEFVELLVSRWAYLDPNELILQFQADDQRMKELADRAGNGLEGNSAEAQLSYEWGNFNAMMAGWSKKDPKAAWNATKKPDGRVSHLVLFNDDFGYLTPIRIFENLAAVDAEYAWNEFAKFPDDRFGFYRESILKGISRGLVEETDWEEALNKAVALSGIYLDELKHVIRENLLSRWVADDFDAARNWFFSAGALPAATEERDLSLDSSTARFLFGQTVDPNLQMRIRVSMRPSIVMWMARDFDSALAWLVEHKDVVRELLSKEYEDLDQSVSPKNLRAMMVACFTKEEREKILRQILKEEDYFTHPVGMFCNVAKRKEMHEELGELKISDELVGEIVAKIRGNYILDDDE